MDMHAAIAASTHRQRRLDLAASLGRPILLMGCGARARNLPMQPLPFRQDSTFLYFAGCNEPGAALVIADGQSVLYLPRPADDDPLWHGPLPPFSERAVQYGVDRVADAALLESDLSRLGTVPATLAIADEARNRWLSERLATQLLFGVALGDDELVDAVIAMRRVKTDEELALTRLAAEHSVAAHIAVASAARAGVHERQLTALFEAVLAARGCALGYGTILTQRGEVLHNFQHTDPLRDGALLLVDGGGEIAAGYGCDITRTWAIGGFRGMQRAAYDAVLEAQVASIDKCRPGVRYREVHDATSHVLARFLADEGLLKIGPDEAVERGAHAIFFPHGVGHLLGMDVHDLENFGDRPSYPPGQGRPEQFGTCNLRLDLPLEEGWLVTVEPGFYIVPTILADPHLRSLFADAVDFERAETWAGFGGIRIEDDILITAGTPENLTSAVPSDPDEAASLVGSGLTIDVIIGTG